jgi:hypothetical protein
VGKGRRTYFIFRTLILDKLQPSIRTSRKFRVELQIKICHHFPYISNSFRKTILNLPALSSCSSNLHKSSQGTLEVQRSVELSPCFNGLCDYTAAGALRHSVQAECFQPGSLKLPCQIFLKKAKFRLAYGDIDNLAQDWLDTIIMLELSLMPLSHQICYTTSTLPSRAL